MINNALKEEGKIFTPLYIVNVLLDVANYTDAEHILEKHFIDNSAGTATSSLPQFPDTVSNISVRKTERTV